MELISLLLLLLPVLLWISYTFCSKIRGNNYRLPPGPFALPIFGHNLQLARNAPYYLSKWAKKYGKLYTIKLGNGKDALVISDVKLLRQLFGKMASAGKVDSHLMDIAFDGHNGIGNCDGKIWQEHREFCIKALKTFGLRGGKQVESMILPEVENLRSELEQEMSSNGRVFLEKMLSTAIKNIMWTVITGEKTDLMEKFTETFKKAGSSGLEFIRWLRYVAPRMSGYNEYDQAAKNIRNFVHKCFKMHEMYPEKYDDVVSAYIDHMRKLENSEEASFQGESGYWHSVNSALALVLASTFSTTHTLQFLFFYLSVHPNVQRKVQEEIDEQTGRNREPRLADRERMPFANAVIQETLRKSSVAPLGLLHRLMEPITFDEYKLPKNLILIANLYHIHHDANIWGDPENFRPERFLENEGALKEFLIPFSVGKRKCFGEPLVVDMLFLFLTNVLQKFTFLPEEGVNRKLYMEPEVGFMLTPKHVPVKVVKRNENLINWDACGSKVITRK